MIKPERCVTTLPISPTRNPSIGLILMPFLMDAFSKKLGTKSVLSLNVNGSKLNGEDIEKHAGGYISSLESINIYPDFIWRDDQETTILLVNSFLNYLFKKEYVFTKTASIMRCECGTVETLRNAENISTERGLSFLVEGKKYCKLCNKEAKEYREEVCLFQFPDFIKIEKVFPSFYQKELEAMIDRFRKYQFLISRSRKSALSLKKGRKKFFIDVDFIWQMLLPVLRRYGYNVEILVGSGKTLMACCFSMMFSQLIDQKQNLLVLPPYYLASGRKELKQYNHLIDNLLLDYDSKSMRLLLAIAINWKKKESVVEFDLLKLISKMSYRLYAEKGITGIEDALNDFDGSNVKTILSRAKKTREVFEDNQLFGLI